MKDYKFRAWTGEKMIYNIVPWQWDFCLTVMAHTCIESIGPDGSEAQFEVRGYKFKEIMQFTGLKEIGGLEVYAGDILEENGYLFTVEWDNQWSKFKLTSHKVIQYPEWNRGVMMTRVGNIYENADLLK